MVRTHNGFVFPDTRQAAHTDTVKRVKRHAKRGIVAKADDFTVNRLIIAPRHSYP